MIQDDEEINFHHKFNDSDIDRIPRNIAIKLLKQFAMNKGVGATDKYFVQKSLTQLHHELKEVRDEMAKQDKQPDFDNTVGAKFESTTQKSQSNATNDQGQNTKPSHPKPPKLNENQQRAHNLWGVDASNFNPSKDSTTNANVENDSMDNDEGYDVVTLNRREQYVHVKLETSSDLIHIPKKLEEFIRHLRSGDPNIHILPYHAVSIKNSEIIGHEKSLPQEEEGISVYIDNINTDSSKLFFSIRIATINIEKVKTSVYTYCKKTGSWTDFVAFKSRKIFPAGFFYRMSPYYHNRDDFEEYIYSKAPHVRGKLTIYRKEVFHWDENNTKIRAQAIVLDGAIEHKNDILTFLYEHKWEGRYQDVAFVPYKTNESFTPRALINMIKQQDEYIKSLDRIIINVKNAQTMREVENKKCSFQSWLYNATITNRRLITGVEVAPNDLIRIMCHKKDKFEVERAMLELYDQTLTAFGQEDTEDMLDQDALKKIKSTHSTEISHSKRLISLSGNPQGPSDSPTTTRPHKKAYAYYGSYLDASKNESNQNNESMKVNDSTDLTQMKATLNELVQKQNEMEKSIPLLINTTVDAQLSKINNEINQIRSETNAKLNSIETSVTNMANNQKSSITEAIKEAMAEVFSNKAPSDAARSPGVGL